MNLKRMWRKESRKRLENQLRRERVNRNWPLHAQRVVDAFTETQAGGAKYGVALLVTEPKWSPPTNQLGTFQLGETTVTLRFTHRLTGTETLVRTMEGEKETINYEEGARLIVHYTSCQGLVQVFFESPKIGKTTKSQTELLFTHTYNTDDVTRDWVISLISRFFVFNRVESVLERPSRLDQWRVRWWRFTDIRNRRGYLEKLHHVLTPWELVLITAIGAIILATL